MLTLTIAAATLLLSSVTAYTNIIGTGGPYDKTDPNYEAFRQGYLSPDTANSLASQGFTFARIQNALNPPFTDSEQNWALEMRFSSVQVDVAGSDEPMAVDNLAFGLGSQGSWPDPNATVWQVCAGLLMSDFPANITSIESTGDAGNGSCVPYFGQECVDAYTYALSHANVYSDGCPRLPSLTDLPACRSQMGFFNQQYSSLNLMNFTSMTAAYNTSYGNNTWYNTTTGEEIEPEYRPLQSGEAFAYQGWEPHALDDTDLVTQRTSALRFAVLTFLPKPRYYQTLSGQSFAYVNTNTRLLCGRPDRQATTQEGEVAGENGVAKLGLSSSMAGLVSVLAAAFLLS